MKSDTLTDHCTCGLEHREEIWMCPHHKYYKGNREYISVGNVIRTVFPTDYSAVPPEVLEHARVRGERVDAYFSTYAQTGNVSIEPGEWSEVLNYLERLIHWWDRSGYEAKAVQQIVYSEEHGVAGTLDLATLEWLLDLKCVSELKSAYQLQLGAYASFEKQVDFPIRNLGIIHVRKDQVRMVPYDREACKRKWAACLAWYKCRLELGNGQT